MITATEIQGFLKGKGVRDVFCFNYYYLLPTADWIVNRLGPASQKLYFDTGITYQQDKFECESFALIAAGHAKLCWAKTTVSEVNLASLAFGMFGYASASHMLNIAICREPDGSLAVRFFEPQQSLPQVGAAATTLTLPCLTERHLTDEDIASAIFCAFF